MKKMLCAVLCGLFLLSLCGCSNWDEAGQFNTLSEYYRTENQEPAPEITAFTLPYLSAETLDPILCSDGCQLTLCGLLYEGLYVLDSSFEPQPLLASGYRYDAETFSYTITIREDIRFSDGTALTPADVAATLERARISPRYSARLAPVETIEADGNAVIITLREDNRLFISRLDIPIVKDGTQDELVPTGTGPYVLHTDDAGACLLPSDCYHEELTLPFERIALLPYKNQESAAYAFSARDVHLLFSNLTATAATAVAGAGQVTDAVSPTLHYIGFNTKDDVFDDAAMRRAMGLCLERESLIDAYLLGHAEAVQFPLPASARLYPEDLEAVTSADSYLRALEELGYNSGQTRVLYMIVNEENAFKVANAQAIAEAMSVGDLQVEVSAMPWEDYLEALEQGRYNMYYAEVTLTGDWDLRSLIGTDGALNYGAFSDATVDLRLHEYITSGRDGQESAMRSLCLSFANTAPILPICFTDQSLLLCDGAAENMTPTAANAFYQIENWTSLIAEN